MATGTLAEQHAGIAGLRGIKRISSEDVPCDSCTSVASLLRKGVGHIDYPTYTGARNGRGSSLDQSLHEMCVRSLFPFAHDVLKHMCLSTRLIWNMSPEAVLGIRRVRCDYNADSWCYM